MIFKCRHSLYIIISVRRNFCCISATEDDEHERFLKAGMSTFMCARRSAWVYVWTSYKCAFWAGRHRACCITVCSTSGQSRHLIWLYTVCLSGAQDPSKTKGLFANISWESPYGDDYCNTKVSLLSCESSVLSICACRGICCMYLFTCTLIHFSIHQVLLY